jgi:hypothetical protein
MNIALLEKIKAHILEEPRRINMYLWGKTFPEGYDAPYIPACRTAGCIAGWACMLSDEEVDEETIENRGKILLDLTVEQANRLFFYVFWPARFVNDYLHLEVTERYKERAKATVERIDHFIKTGGAE